jgi:hypothetical protein
VSAATVHCPAASGATFSVVEAGPLALAVGPKSADDADVASPPATICVTLGHPDMVGSPRQVPAGAAATA